MMHPADYIIHLTLSVFLIVGLYQFYFWRRRHALAEANSNCFPSMHVSVATLAALYLYPRMGPRALLFPALIGISTLFTKQRYLLDVPAGAALGWATFKLFARVA